MSLLDYLGASAGVDDAWEVSLGAELHGAFGGVNGGVVAALGVAVARSLAPGRAPAGVDARFLRGLTAGRTRVVPTLLHRGRTLSCVSVDILDDRERLCTRATVTLVAPEALEPIDVAQPRMRNYLGYADGKPWPAPRAPIRVPLIETFGPREVGRDEHGIATAVRVLWSEPGTTAEAVCVAADISVGPPVMRLLGGRPVPMPNPDLSLRFCADPPLPAVLVSAAQLEYARAGLVSTSIEVCSGEQIVAVGVSTTTLLAGAWPDAMRSAGKRP